MNKLRAYQNKQPNIAADVYIDASAVVIGGVTIGEQSSVWPMTVIRADVNYITVGKRTNIQDGAVLHVTHKSEFNPTGYPLTIGDDVTIGHQCCLHACNIENECLIGIGTIILDNAQICQHTLIAAGSLVPQNKVLDSGYLWLGRPVKKIRALTDDEIIYFKYSANHYINIAKKTDR